MKKLLIISVIVTILLLACDSASNPIPNPGPGGTVKPVDPGETIDYNKNIKVIINVTGPRFDAGYTGFVDVSIRVLYSSTDYFDVDCGNFNFKGNTFEKVIPFDDNKTITSIDIKTSNASSFVNTHWFDKTYKVYYKDRVIDHSINVPLEGTQILIL